MNQVVKIFKGSWNADQNYRSMIGEGDGTPLPPANKENIGHTYRISKSGRCALGYDWKAGYDIMSTGDHWTCLTKFKDEDGNEFEFIETYEDMKIHWEESKKSKYNPVGMKIVKKCQGYWNPTTNVTIVEGRSNKKLPKASIDNRGHSYTIYQNGTTKVEGTESTFRNWIAGESIMSTGKEWVGENHYLSKDGERFVFIDVDTVGGEPYIKFDKGMSHSDIVREIPLEEVKGIFGRQDVTRGMLEDTKKIGIIGRNDLGKGLSNTLRKILDIKSPKLDCVVGIGATGKTNIGTIQDYETKEWVGVDLEMNPSQIEKNFVNKNLIPFELHQRLRLQEYEERSKKDVHPNGIACPKCGSELCDIEPDIIITTLPAQTAIKCTNTKCDFDGFRLK